MNEPHKGHPLCSVYQHLILIILTNNAWSCLEILGEIEFTHLSFNNHCVYRVGASLHSLWHMEHNRKSNHETVTRESARNTLTRHAKSNKDKALLLDR